MNEDILRQILKAETAEEKITLLASFAPEERDIWLTISQAERWANTEHQLALKAANLLTYARHSPSPKGKMYWALGNINLRIGDYAASIEAYEQGAEIFRQDNNLLDLARMGVGMVGAWCQSGQYHKAIESGNQFQATLNQSDEPRDKQRFISIQNNLGATYEYLGHYEEALNKYQEKLAYWESSSDTVRAHVEIGRTLINIGSLKIQLNLLKHARKDLEEGRYRLTANTDNDDYLIDIIRAQIHETFIDILSDQKHPQIKAQFEEIHQKRERVPQDEDLLYADLLEIQWEIETNQINGTQTTRLIELRHELQQMKQAIEIIIASILLAKTYQQQTNFDQAISAYQFAYTEAFKQEAWEWCYESLVGLGETYQANNKVDDARSVWQEAIGISDRMRGLIESYNLRTSFVSDKLLAYQALAKSYINVGQYDDAFYWIERGRARELADLHQQDAEVKERHEPIQITELCAQLDTETAFLLYALILDEIYVFIFCHDGLVSVERLGHIPRRSILLEDLISVHELAGVDASIAQKLFTDFDEYAREVLDKWYNTFFKKIKQNLTGINHLIVSLDGPLHRLPFHAFWDMSTASYLIEQFCIQYTLSGTTWGNRAKKAFPSEPTIYAYAYPNDDLPYAVDEVNEISAIFETTVSYITKDSATKENLNGSMLRTADILHFATHGKFCIDDPLASYIQLADGPLYKSDILELRLATYMVVLSACETGNGLIRGGEYLSLLQSFLLAGVQCTIGTHWAISDYPSKVFMTHFYKQLSTTSMAPEKALQNACLAMIESEIEHHRHPCYWASFFLLGRT